MMIRKATLLLFFSLLSATVVFANPPSKPDDILNPIKFKVGAMGLYKTSFLLNSNVAQDGDEQNYKFSTSLSYGIHAGIFFTSRLGVELNVLYGNFRQDYEGKDDMGSYETRSELTAIDIPLLLKLGNRFYFEVGPQLSLINKAEYSIEDHYANISSVPDVTGDRKGDFKSSYTSVLVGLGGNIGIVEKLRVNVGLRLGYALTDVEGIDGLGRKLKDDTLYEEDANGDKVYGSYARTSPVFAGFKLGITYKI